MQDKIKICKKHNCVKNRKERIVKNKCRVEYICTLCDKERRAKYKQEHKIEINIYNKQYRIDNKDKINQSRRGKYKESAKKYQAKNRKKITDRQVALKKEKRKNNPSFRVAENISSIIRQSLKKYNSSKNGKSIWKFLPYTACELKNHIEILFSHYDNLTNDGKIWMTWDNHGIYDPKTWDDNDPSTWTWQIDHIIPQSDLPYDSMEHPNFLKANSLSNLRPLSAKQNCIDGARRIRHIKKC